MAPLMLSYGQSIIDDIRNQQLVAKNGHPATATEAPTINAQDDAEVSIENDVSSDSSDISLDQSNNGSSLVNLYWASFSTGPSSVLAVVLTGLLISGCCYFRGRHKRQTRARHTELLHALSSSTHHVSSALQPQSGAYPGPASRSTNAAETAGSPAYPIGRYSAPPASLLADSRVVPPPTKGLLPSLSTTLEPCVTSPSLTRHSRLSRMSTVPPRLWSLLSTASRPPQSRSIAVSNRVPAKPASVPSTADLSSSVSPVVASTTSSKPSSGRIRPAHSISD